MDNSGIMSILLSPEKYDIAKLSQKIMISCLQQRKIETSETNLKTLQVLYRKYIFPKEQRLYGNNLLGSLLSENQLKKYGSLPTKITTKQVEEAVESPPTSPTQHINSSLSKRLYSSTSINSNSQIEKENEVKKFKPITWP